VKASFLLLLTLAAWAGGGPAPALASPAGLTWSTNWTPLFNGRDLSNWTNTDFVARGAVTVRSNQLILAAGGILTGVNWTNGALPTNNFEIEVDALKSDGSDFFCGLTFPVGESFCSLILGGWGGSITGLSSLAVLMIWTRRKTRPASRCFTRRAAGITCECA
jgi:hypothetical protein